MNYQEQYQKAKGHGYSDEEIIDFLSKKDPSFSEKLKTAEESGYSPSEVISFFSKSPEEKKGNVLLDYGKSAIKGVAEGLYGLRQMVSPIGEEIYNPEAASKGQEKVSQFLEEKLPTEPGFIPESIQRFTKSLPSNLSFPGGKVGSTVARTGAAALSGQTAKELGFGELGQGLAELGAYITPDFANKLLAKGEYGELIKKARELGLTDKEIAPLVDVGFTERFLSKVINRGGRTQERLKASKKAIDRSYSNIKGSEEAKGVLPYDNAVDTVKQADKILFDLPADIEGLIKNDYDKLLSGPMTGESLIRFWEAVNFQFSKKGGSRLQLLKDPIGKALEKIDPKLKKDFDTVNQLASNQHQISKALRLRDVDKTNNLLKQLGANSSIGAIGSYFTGNLWPLASMLALSGAKKGFKETLTEMATNPRFKQLRLKFINQVNDMKYPAAQHTLKLMSKTLSSEFPEAADMIYNFSEQNLESLFGGEE